MDRLLDFLSTVFGKTAVALALCAFAGGAVVWNIDSFLVTPEVLSAEKAAVIKKTLWNKLDIIEWKMRTLLSEKIQLQNYIDIKQNGTPNAMQQQRLDSMKAEEERLHEEKKNTLKELEK